ncbi:hypothetical protein [Anoxybacillus ayderensis]|uniref:hypothetical protein n=1 Tax=Anoxybacillus ayderensis TaxID=265546 RepID=UPI002E245630|nr:hypothetical protein [Anoxybacillus ayderensis]
MKIFKVPTDELPIELQEMLSEKLIISAQLFEYDTTDHDEYVVSFIDLKKDEMVELVFENGKVTRKKSISLVLIKKAMELHPVVFGKEIKQ